MFGKHADAADDLPAGIPLSDTATKNCGVLSYRDKQNTDDRRIDICSGSHGAGLAFKTFCWPRTQGARYFIFASDHSLSGHKHRAMTMPHNSHAT